MSSGGGDKTEEPTPKKLRDARLEGRIPRSPEISAWASMFVASLLLKYTVTSGADLCRRLMDDVAVVVAAPELATALQVLVTGLTGSLKVLAPMGLGLLVTGWLTTAAQGGVFPTTKPLKPKWSRMSPVQGIKRMLGPHGAWEATKSVLKVAVLGYLAYSSIAGLLPVLLQPGAAPAALLLESADRALALMRNTAAAGMAMAMADYGMQRRQVNKGLRMTKNEVKDEYKQSEGDPAQKAAIRSRQMEMSRNRMMSEVATADVVLVNPTHVAVALKYDASKGAPRVVAKGAGAVATKIREEAAKAGVPLVSNIPLARAIYKACDLNTEIPAQLYGAVAQVLAFIFALKARRGTAAGTHTVADAQVPDDYVPRRERARV